MTIANATPLIALDAVVLDTETTGLDPAKSNLIEIGAIRLRAGRIDETGSYRRLIRPPQPVPAQFTALTTRRSRMRPPFRICGRKSRHISATRC
jgi:DNA polymerase III epsilon subunit-like protein